ncbi:Altered inheritance of mitochondria protein 18 mitochondrial [Cryptotrichosporon argae]
MSFRAGLSSALRVSRTSLKRNASCLAVIGTATVAVYTFETLDLAPFRPLRLDSVQSPNLKTPAPTSSAFRLDPDTSIQHPLVLAPGPGAGLELVGLGVRTVSFLRVKVYSAAFYAERAVLDALDSLEGFRVRPSSADATHALCSRDEGWDESEMRDGNEAANSSIQTYTPAHLLTPPTPDGPQMTGEALVRRLLYASAVAVRIVPVRSTDFAHLRDGFTRALLARQKLARARGELSEADDERLATSMQALKAAFPAGSVPKGKALLLVSSNGSLQISYEGRTLGTVDDAWVACELVMAYFADKDVISPKLKDDVARGLAEVGKR